MAPSIDEQGMLAWRTFLEAHAAVIRRLERELRDERDLPIAWYDALVQLDEVGGSLRMHELADRLLLSRSATTRFADRLERAGLVERRPATQDRRGTEIILTDRGRATLRDAAPVHLRGVAEHFAARLSEDEARTLRAILEKLTAIA